MANVSAICPNGYVPEKPLVNRIVIVVEKTDFGVLRSAGIIKPNHPKAIK